MKYIGGFRGATMLDVSAQEAERVMRANQQYGRTLAERRATCMRLLRRGEILSDGRGFRIRLAMEFVPDL